jgi:hypothetical protein
MWASGFRHKPVSVTIAQWRRRCCEGSQLGRRGSHMEINEAAVWSASDKSELREVLGLEKDDELESLLAKIALAALAEYREMLLEGGAPSRADEVLEHRLYFLIKHYFDGRIPSEPEVSRILHETLTKSRTLIRNVLTRYSRELDEELISTLVALVAGAQETEDGNWRLVIQSDNALERLNQIIAAQAPTLDPVRKVPNSARTYSIHPDSYNVLRKHLGLT